MRVWTAEEDVDAGVERCGGVWVLFQSNICTAGAEERDVFRGSAQTPALQRELCRRN